MRRARNRGTEEPPAASQGAFLYLKCSLERFHIVAKLPGKALAVWALIHHRLHLTRLEQVTLPSALLAEAGVGRNVKARALKDLERIGLIRVDRRPGRALRVALVPLPEDGTAGAA
jgi:hypothetical protein